MNTTPLSRPRLIRLLLVSVLFAVVCINAAFAADSPAALDSDPKGWTDLMPAADLKGWTRVAIPPTNELGRAQWHLDDSRQLLVCDGDGGHDMLRYDQSLTNCIFHVEFRYVPLPGKKHYYNSGIFIRNSADGAIWHQCQLTTDGGYLFGETPVKGLPQSFLAQAEDRCMKPVGEWNITEVTAMGPKLSAWVNGAVMSEYDTCEVPAGFIALEAEGYAIEFRNLKLKVLP